MSEYDNELEQEEENDLMNYWNDNDNDNNDEYDEIPRQKRRKRRHHRINRREEKQDDEEEEVDGYSANYVFGGDDADGGASDGGDGGDGGGSNGEDGGSEESEEESGSSEMEGGYSDKEQLTAFLLSFFLGMNIYQNIHKICMIQESTYHINVYLGGVGAGRFYVEDYAVASIKLCLPLIVCIVVAIVGCLLATTGNESLNEPSEPAADGILAGQLQKLMGGAGIGMCISSCGCCAWLIWWLVDWILFAVNEIPDADGKELYPM